MTCAAVALCFLGDRYFTWRNDFPKRVPAAVLVVTGWGYLMQYGTDYPLNDWRALGWVMIGVALLAYTIYFRSKTSAGLSLLSVIISLAFLFEHAYPLQLNVSPMIAGFGAVILYGIVFERLYRLASARFDLPIKAHALEKLDIVLVAIPSVLLILMLERVPLLADFYLTISWTIAAVTLFGIAFITQQKYYRYAGLMTFGLALVRVTLWDTRELSGMEKILAWMVLGAVLVAVGGGYVWARGRMKAENSPNHERHEKHEQNEAAYQEDNELNENTGKEQNANEEE